MSETEATESTPALAVTRGYYDWVDKLLPITDDEKATLKSNLLQHYIDDTATRWLVFRDIPEVRRAIRLPDEPEPRR